MATPPPRERPSIPDVKAALQRFAQDKDFPQTFLLTGSWGVGKTHLWRQVLADAKAANRCAREKYAYCSLFGLESIALVRDRIFSALTDITGNRATEADSVERVVRNFSSVNDALVPEGQSKSKLATIWNGLTSRWKKVPEWAVRFPALSSYEPLVRAATFAFVKDAIICIDDLERKSTSLVFRDILGFVSSLREERRCKVIVIANEDMLNDEERKTLQELREKVFDLVVTFDPPNDYAQEIAIPADAQFRDEWIKRTNYVNLTNIRILRRIFSLSLQLTSLLEGAPEEMRRSCIASLVLIGACHFQPSADLPPMNLMFLPGGGAYSSKADAKELRKKWAEFLMGYGWNSADELDHTLLQFIESGCIHEKNLRQCVQLSKRLHEEGKRREALGKPWDLFWGSFADDEGSVVKSFLDTHYEHSLFLSPMNLDGAVRLLRELGYSEDADKLIAHYIDSRKGDRDALDLREYAFWREIRDAPLVAAFDAAFNAVPVAKDLAEVLLRMGKTHGWNISDSVFMRTVTVDQFEKVFREVKGEDLNTVIKSAVEYSGGTDEDRAVSGRAMEALVRIGKSSKLNRSRVLRYGVSVPEEAGDQGGGG